MHSFGVFVDLISFNFLRRTRLMRVHMLHLLLWRRIWCDNIANYDIFCENLNFFDFFLFGFVDFVVAISPRVRIRLRYFWLDFLQLSA